MDVPDNLLCVFSARVEEQRDSYVIEVPKHEITNVRENVAFSEVVEREDHFE